MRANVKNSVGNKFNVIPIMIIIIVNINDHYHYHNFIMINVIFYLIITSVIIVVGFAGFLSYLHLIVIAVL